MTAALPDKNAALLEMNERYCYLLSKDVVVRIENMQMFETSRFVSGGHLANNFCLETTTRQVPARGTFCNTYKKEKLAKAWIEWAGRREVENIVYEPGRDQFFGNSINRWRGMGVAPVPGNVHPWLELLEKLIPDPKTRAWFVRWCAYPLQYLGTKLKTAVIFWGVLQGNGKTTVATTLSRIYGSNAAAISEADLSRPFNEWALDKQFISANEISGGDKRGSADVMKELIAGAENIRINQKFLPEIQIRNCINFLFTSNHPNSFYLEPSDRRYCVIEVPSVLPDRKFFDDYYAWLDNGGAAHLYQHLLNLPLGDFHPHVAPPETDAKKEMIEIGKSELDRWLERTKEERPNIVLSVDDFLDEYRSAMSGSGVKTSGMLAALRRLGAVHKRVRIHPRRLSLWSFDRKLEKADDCAWAEAYGKRRQK